MVEVEGHSTANRAHQELPEGVDCPGCGGENRRFRVIERVPNVKVIIEVDCVECAIREVPPEQRRITFT